MASYVVRIYRAAERSQPSLTGSSLTGVVMGIEDETRHPFRNVSELWSILSGLERFDDAPARSPHHVHTLPLYE